MNFNSILKKKKSITYIINLLIDTKNIWNDGLNVRVNMIVVFDMQVTECTYWWYAA